MDFSFEAANELARRAGAEEHTDVKMLSVTPMFNAETLNNEVTFVFEVTHAPFPPEVHTLHLVMTNDPNAVSSEDMPPWMQEFTHHIGGFLSAWVSDLYDGGEELKEWAKKLEQKQGMKVMPAVIDFWNEVEKERNA